MAEGAASLNTLLRSEQFRKEYAVKHMPRDLYKNLNSRPGRKGGGLAIHLIEEWTIPITSTRSTQKTGC